MNKVQKINSADKGSLHQWLQGVFFAIYYKNVGPVDVTDIYQSVLAVGRYFPFPIDQSPTRLRGVTSEGQQALDNFEAESPLMFRQGEFSYA